MPLKGMAGSYRREMKEMGPVLVDRYLKRAMKQLRNFSFVYLKNHRCFFFNSLIHKYGNISNSVLIMLPF